MREIDAVPFLAPERMRADEDCRFAKPAIISAADVFGPLANDLRFDGAAAKQGGADIEDERPIRGQAHTAAELFAGTGRLAIEPLVVAMRASDDDAIGGNV